MVNAKKWVRLAEGWRFPGLLQWLVVTSFFFGGSVSAESVRFIPDARDSWNQRVRLMREARSSIELFMFIWEDDRVGIEMAELLRDAAERGVQVRVLCDALARSVPRRTMEVLERHPNLHIHHYHPVKLNRPLWLNRRLHDKMVIVDQKHLILGGRNFADKYFDRGEDWNYIDLDVLVSGNTARSARSYFESLWESTEVKDLISLPRREAKLDPFCDGKAEEQLFADRGFGVESPGKSMGTKAEASRTSIQVPGSRVQFVHETVPRQKDEAVCLRRLRELIGEARSEVWITTPWLVMTNETRDLFLDCLARGVKVHVLTNSLHANKDFLVFAAHLKSCEDLAAEGASIHCLPGPNSIHSKGIVIDQRLAIVGTQNMDPRSEFWNTESMVVLQSADAAGDLRRVILQQAEGSALLSGHRSVMTSPGALSLSTQIKRAFLPVLKLVSPFVRSCL